MCCILKTAKSIFLFQNFSAQDIFFIPAGAFKLHFLLAEAWLWSSSVPTYFFEHKLKLDFFWRNSSMSLA
jgi:hypothetical protein